MIYLRFGVALYDVRMHFIHSLGNINISPGSDIIVGLTHEQLIGCHLNGLLGQYDIITGCSLIQIYRCQPRILLLKFFYAAAVSCA